MSADEIVQDNGELWAPGPRELRHRLNAYYDIAEDGSLWYYADWHDPEDDARLSDVLVYANGDGEHLIAADVPRLGHGPSGAAGFHEDDLPDRERVQAVIEEVRG